VHYFAVAELLGGDWPERCLAACMLLEQAGRPPTVSDARDCLDAMQACQDERIESYTRAANMADEAAKTRACKHIPALAQSAVEAVGWAAAVAAIMTGRDIVQDAEAEAVALGVPAVVVSDSVKAGLEAALLDELNRARQLRFQISAPPGWRGYETVNAGYDPRIPIDFLPTLHFIDWLTTNQGASFACANAGPGGRPVTPHKLGRLLGDVVTGERFKQRQWSGDRVQIRGWSVEALAKVWAEEERSTEGTP
jgi:hypothetical protein